MVGFTGDGFEIEYRWKEEVLYWEGDEGFLFDAGWGADPPVLYIPSAAMWAEVMPAWCRERRDEVVTRLRNHSRHALQEDVHGYYRNEASARLVSVRRTASTSTLARTRARARSGMVGCSGPTAAYRNAMGRCEPLRSTDVIGRASVLPTCSRRQVVKNRLHLDVRVGTGLRGEERLTTLGTECARLVALGARSVRLLPADGDNESCLVMQDIEGNEFDLD